MTEKKGEKNPKVKADKPGTAELPKREKSSKSAKVSEELAPKVLEIMAKLQANGVEISSRLISDKLGLEADKGRGAVRRIMKQLEKAGKVVIEQKASKGKRKQYVYKLKENK